MKKSAKYKVLALQPSLEVRWENGLEGNSCRLAFPWVSRLIRQPSADKDSIVPATPWFPTEADAWDYFWQVHLRNTGWRLWLYGPAKGPFVIPAGDTGIRPLGIRTLLLLATPFTELARELRYFYYGTRDERRIHELNAAKVWKRMWAKNRAAYNAVVSVEAKPKARFRIW